MDRISEAREGALRVSFTLAGMCEGEVALLRTLADDERLNRGFDGDPALTALGLIICMGGYTPSRGTGLSREEEAILAPLQQAAGTRDIQAGWVAVGSVMRGVLDRGADALLGAARDIIRSARSVADDPSPTLWDDTPWVLAAYLTGWGQRLAGLLDEEDDESHDSPFDTDDMDESDLFYGFLEGRYDSWAGVAPPTTHERADGTDEWDVSAFATWTALAALGRHGYAVRFRRAGVPHGQF